LLKQIWGFLDYFAGIFAQVFFESEAMMDLENTCKQKRSSTHHVG